MEVEPPPYQFINQPGSLNNMLISSSTLLTTVLLLLLIVTTIEDIRAHKIRNLWILSSIVIAVVGFTAIGGLKMAALSMLGLIVGGLLLIPFYLTGGMAAGDIKLMGVVGAFLGPKAAFFAVLTTLVAGSIIGIIVLAFNGGVLALLSRYYMSLKLLFLTGSPALSYLPPSPKEPAGIRFPYALAISVGTISVILYLNPTALRLI